MFRPVFLGAVLLAPALSLAAPSTLTAQGRLLDPAGGPVEGSPDLTFSIYDDAAASNPALWDETFQVVLAGG